MHIIERKCFAQLLDVLKSKGFDLIGPTVEAQAIIYNDIESVDDLPIGWTDDQRPGQYRLKKRDDQALFGYVVGPNSWKKFLFPPSIKLWSAKRVNNRFEIEKGYDEVKNMAFIGVRSCDLAAISIQNKVFVNGSFTDSYYKKRLEGAFLVSVNCIEPRANCFCPSMETGPKALKGYDLSLTEVIQDHQHYFVIKSGSAKGEEVLSEIPHSSATADHIGKEKKLIEKSMANMGRNMNTENIKELLYKNLEHPQWSKIADRCLSCSNCTLVCPTCFCTTVEDVTDLTGNFAERWRKWDSCFTMDFSYIHGGNIRSSTKSRYRQWMTHKLASWQDQFGTSGCVGCGRCITWCPVGINITEEANSIRESRNINNQSS